MKYPKKFTVTITEKDRQKAGVYGDCDNCIAATAVKRKFPHASVSEGVDGLKIDGIPYEHRILDYSDVFAGFHDDGTYYAPSVVGLTFTCTRVS